MGFIDTLNPEPDLNPLKKQIEKLEEAIKDLKRPPHLRQPEPGKTDEMYQMIKQMQEQLNKQEELLRRIALTVSRLHQEGQINDEVFHNLREFLKPYYENPYQEKTR